MANPTTNFGWVMPTSSSLVTNLPADFNTFGQAVDTSMSELLGGTTGQVLSKTSNTNMDFTWVTPTDQTPLTTKGDLFTFTTVDARLGVGANGTVLTADSAESSGLKWATPAGGLTLITTQTASNVASITFDNVFSSTYSNYLIVYSQVITSTGNTTADLYFKFRYAGPTTQAAMTYALNGVTSAGTAFTAGDTTLGAAILSRNLGDKTSGQMFVKQVGSINEYGVATGQNFDPWGEEVINYGLIGASSRTFLGFIISASAGSISGTFTVYGLAKS